jgi:type II secretory pathway pseudopilin PulG
MLVSRQFRGQPRARSKRAEDGYLLMVLLLFITLLVIASAAVAPQLAMQIRRDREEEMIHRAVQYARAIKRFYRKNNRYPTRIEELENTNNLRFLRKRYKDPITGKEFRLLRFGDVKMFPQGVAGLTPAGANAQALGGLTGGAQAQVGAATGLAGNAGGMNSGFGNPTVPANPGLGTPPEQAGAPQPEAEQDSRSAGGASANSDEPQEMKGPISGQQPGAAGPQNAIDGQNPANQVFGGGPVVGVASTSHKVSVREFNKKHHYNEWQFIYDPTSDRGGLLKGPVQTGGAGVGIAGANQNLQGQGMQNPSGQNPSANPGMQGPGGMTGNPQMPGPGQPQAPPEQ